MVFEYLGFADVHSRRGDVHRLLARSHVDLRVAPAIDRHALGLALSLHALDQLGLFDLAGFPSRELIDDDLRHFGSRRARDHQYHFVNQEHVAFLGSPRK